MPVVPSSLSMSNHLDTCDSLHVINLASDVVSIAAILLLRYTRYISYLMLHIYLAARHYCHGSCKYIYFYELLWNYEFIITKIYFH